MIFTIYCKKDKVKYIAHQKMMPAKDKKRAKELGLSLVEEREPESSEILVETGVNKNQGRNETGTDGLIADTDWWGECEGMKT